MPTHWIIYYTDALLYVLVAGLIAFTIWTYRHEYLRAPWRQIARRPLAMAAAIVLCCYAGIGLLDSVHFYTTNDPAKIESLLDVLTAPLAENNETTYSAPFSSHAYNKTTLIQPDGKMIWIYPALQYAKDSGILHKSIIALSQGLILWLLISVLFIFCLARSKHNNFWQQLKNILCHHRTTTAWCSILLTVGVLLIVGFWALILSHSYHILGTDKVGQDIFYQTLKSIRTGMVIGTLTTLVMLPFAILMGLVAGYFGGLLDDIIQYIYTTLSSVPGVLLISAMVLALQIYITNHTQLFPNLEMRADARLLILCIILGITSWTGLCRVLRGETLKLREVDFVQAAVALGASKYHILTRHILPNVMHIILITIVIDFSALVLSEAVLTYVGIGVDPTTISWGNMINSSRLELAREPIVWWPLVAAFISMFTLVLAANLFADAVRDAFDPSLKDAT